MQSKTSREEYHTERGKGTWEYAEGDECRVGCGATTLVGNDAGSEVGGRGKEPNVVAGVLGETDRSDPEGELVKSVVASSSSSESLHLDEASSSSSSSSSSPCWESGDVEGA